MDENMPFLPKGCVYLHVCVCLLTLMSLEYHRVPYVIELTIFLFKYLTIAFCYFSLALFYYFLLLFCIFFLICNQINWKLKLKTRSLMVR